MLLFGPIFSDSNRSSQTPKHLVQPTSSLRSAGILPSTERMSYTLHLTWSHPSLHGSYTTFNPRAHFLLPYSPYKISDHYTHLVVIPGRGEARSVCPPLPFFNTSVAKPGNGSPHTTHGTHLFSRSVAVRARTKASDSDTRIVGPHTSPVVVYRRQRIRLDPNWPLELIYLLSIFRRCGVDTSLRLAHHSTPTCRHNETELS